jgi:hypothetical protein
MEGWHLDSWSRDGRSLCNHGAGSGSEGAQRVWWSAGRRVPCESGGAAMEEADNAATLVCVPSSLAPFQVF